MSRLAFRNFSSYLILSPPKDQIVATGLRRARGVHPIKTNSLRSRPGNLLVNNVVNSNSMCMFNGKLYQFAANQLYVDGAAIKNIVGDYLSFLQAPPTSGKRDELFISNGDALWKVDKDGVITQWGITPPVDGFAAAVEAPNIIIIDNMDSTSGWTASSVTMTLDTAKYIQGIGSIECVVAQNTIGAIYRDLAIDLSQFADSSLTSGADYISLQALIDIPNNVSAIQIIFSLGDDTFSHDTFAASISTSISTGTPSNTDSSANVGGVGDLTEYSSISGEQLTQQYLLGLESSASSGSTNINDNTYSSPTANQALNAYMQSALSTSGISIPNQWQNLLLPLSLFSRGGYGLYTWADVKAVKILIATNTGGAANVWIDDLKLIGGTGLQGNYTYYITYLNSKTGSRSNPNPTAMQVNNVLRQSVVLSDLPVSVDPQVDTVEVWRTVGNGGLPFFCSSVPNGTLNFIDNIADNYFLDPRSTTTYLGVLSIYNNNNQPFPAFGPACLFNASILWTSRDTDNAGSVYYSPIGFSEGVSGFTRATFSNDALQTVLTWNGTPWALSFDRVFAVSGTLPYYTKEVYGCPGTPYPQTAVSTPFGIAYQAVDGIRAFTGLQSQLVGLANMGRLLTGEDVENLKAFTGKVACYFKNEYIISDGEQTLAYRPSDDTWRDLGVGFTGLYTDPITKQAYGSNANGTYKLEVIGQYTDGGYSIPFEVENRSVMMDVDKLFMVNYLHLDINTGGQQLDVILIGDGIETTIGTLQNTSRQVVMIPIQKEFNTIGVRLKGSLTAEVEIFGIEIDVDISQSHVQDKYFKNILET